MAIFIDLPQELRDQILGYAIAADVAPSLVLDRNDKDGEEHILANESSGITWTLQQQTQRTRLAATYLSVMLSCRQMYYDVQHLVTSVSASPRPTAKLTLDLVYPSVTPTWTSIPCPPEQIRELDISIKLARMFHPTFFTKDQQNTLLRPVFEMLRHYIHRGPLFTSAAPLPKPLDLDVLRISMSPAIPLEDMTWVFGNPTLQLDVLYGHFQVLVRRLARSGLLYGSVRALECRLMEGELSLIHI